MKTTKILLGLALVAAAFTGCKEAKSSKTANAVYIAEAATSNAKKIATNEFGGKATLTARTGASMGDNVYFDWKVDPAVLNAYNAKHETSFELLPAAYYEMNRNLDTIKAGVTTSKPLTINIKAMGALPTSVKYAIPVTLANVVGGNVLESSKTIVILIDRVIVTNVIQLKGYSIKYDFAEDKKLNDIKAWTAEFLINPEDLSANNQALYSTGPDEVYSRFGDVVCKPTQIQVKTQGGQPNTAFEFKTKTWYHVAYVYNGASLRIIVDGKTDVNFPSPVNNFGYRIHNMSFGGATKCQVAEIRLWTLARTDAQLIDAKYAVDPKTPGLQVYWKCDEGSGTAIKDYTGHGYDGTTSSADVSWISGVRFPDNM